MKRSLLRAVAAHSALLTVTIGAPLLACSTDAPRPSYVEEEPTPSPEPEADAAPPAKTATPVTPTPTTPQKDAEAPPEDDCVRPLPSEVCGVAPQCGCPSTETCDVVDLAGSTACITAGNAALGLPCTATAGCARGLSCLFGVCHALCDPTTSAACPSAKGGGACVQLEGSSAPIPNLAMCRVSCALEDAASCGGKTNAGVGVCFFDESGGTDCQRGGARTVNQSCSTPTDCGPGLVCATVSTTSTCKRWCRVGTSDCGTGKTCAGFKTPVTVGETVYGTCP